MAKLKKSPLKYGLLGNEGIQGFEWPEFNNNHCRIVTNSNRYQKMSLSEAFAKAYGVEIGKVSEIVNEVPKDLRIGDVIKAQVLSIVKNRVEFDTTNVKASLTSGVNLHRFNKFKDFIPSKPIDVKVMNIIKDRVVVDPIAPLVDNFLQDRLGSPWRQKTITGGKVITVKNLRLTRGGFTGDAVIPEASDFVGEDYTVEAFIPGSQIVLNITDDFEQFIGKEVKAFVLNYIPKPGEPGKMSLICSVKEYLKFQGEMNMIPMFKLWCDNEEAWKALESTKYDGIVTGIINSSKKTGVFVEIPELNITGMVHVNASDLVNYKRNSSVLVKIAGFDEEMYFNQSAQQLQHVEPYIIKDGALEKCNLKPILEFV